MADATTQLSSSMDSLMREYHIITHNLANVSTTGYKRICNSFSKSLDAQKQTDDGDLSSKLDFSQGSVAETGRTLDFALYGKGFFVLETPDGPLYTRNGIFHINNNSQIVSFDGRLVAGEAGPITIPGGVGPSQLHVSSDGSISAGGTTIGKFKLVNFGSDESKLLRAGANSYQKPENIEPVTAENIVVKQGYQEASNVRIVDELVDMIMVSRLYESTMKFISSQKDASSSLIGVAMG